MVVPSLPDPEKLAAVRDAIPALGAGIYLNTGSVGPLPAETAAAMADMAAYERDVGRAHADYFEETLARMSEARAGVAAVLGTDVSAVALTHATTEGMNAATLLPDWRSGGRAVTTAHEHAAVAGPLVALRDRIGVDVTFVDAGDDGDDERTVAAFDQAITATPGWSRSRTCCGRPARSSRSPGSPSWPTPAVRLSSSTAPRPPARSRSASTSSAPTCMPCRRRSGCSARKAWARLVVDPGVLDRFTPALAGWYSFEAPDGLGEGDWWPDARRFESSSGFHRPSIVGMARSIGWLSMFVGLDFVLRRGPAQAAAAADRLAAIPGVELLTPRERMATLVTFRIAGWPAQAALDELGARVFTVARTIPGLDAVRLSVGFFTTDDELERVAEIVELLAAHTPETLPPRRTLTMLGG